MLLAELLAKLEANAPKPRPAHIKGVGDVHVLPLTVGQVDSVTAESDADETPGAKKRGVVRSIMMALCNEQGERYGASPELARALDAQKWSDLQPVVDVIEGRPAKND